MSGRKTRRESKGKSFRKSQDAADARAAALQEIVESQKLRRTLQIELKTREQVIRSSGVLTHTASQTLTVSGVGNTDTLQNDLREEIRLAKVSPSSIVTLEVETEKRVSARSHSFTTGGDAVAPPSPRGSQIASGARTRIGPYFPSSRSLQVQQRSPRSQSTSPSNARSPRKLALSTNTVTTARSLPNLELDIGVKKKKKLSKSPKPKVSADATQVKPLVNTYHLMKEKPHILSRKGVPRELESLNMKDIFTWVSTENDSKTEYATTRPNRNQLAKQVSNSQSFLPLPSAAQVDRQPHTFASTGICRHQPVSVTSMKEANDGELSDEEYKPISPRRRCTGQPLVSTSFQPSPPIHAKKGVAMFIPLASTSLSSPKKPSRLVSAPPPSRRYSTSELAVFKKRKSLERRQQKSNSLGSLPPELRTTTRTSDRTNVDSDAQIAERYLDDIRRQGITGGSVISQTAQQLKQVTEEFVDPRAAAFEQLVNVFDRTISNELAKRGFTEVSIQNRLNKYVSPPMPIEQRLDDVTRQFEKFLVSRGLRESCEVRADQENKVSAVSNSKIDVWTPPKPSAATKLAGAHQDTPRPAGIFLQGTPPRVQEKIVQTETAYSAADDPNFIFEWRHKYLRGSGLFSSTPKRNTTDLEDVVCGLDASCISSERAPEALNCSSAESDTLSTGIDDSPLREARELLRQLDNSQKERSRRLQGELKSVARKSAEDDRNDANDYLINTKPANRSSLKESSSSKYTTEIEGEDILEEARRVLREINSSQISNKSTGEKSNSCRSLLVNFDEIFENELSQKRAPSPIVNLSTAKRSPKKSFAPSALSTLASNELDFLEDCNDTLLKISEVSRAKSYAFAKETGLANEFLRRENQRNASTPIASGGIAPFGVEDVVGELRRSLQEAFDQIEQNSKEMSRSRKDFPVTLVHERIPAEPEQSTRIDDESQPPLAEAEDNENNNNNNNSNSNSNNNKNDSNNNSYDKQKVAVEESCSQGSKEKAGSASKSGSVSLETTSLTEDKQSSSTEGSPDCVQNSDSVSEETPSRSSSGKSPKSSPTVSTVRTEVPRLDLTPVETGSGKSSISTSTTLNEQRISAGATTGYVPTGRTEDSRAAEKPGNNGKTEPAGQPTSPTGIPIAGPSTSAKTLLLTILNHIERREHQYTGQRSESLNILKHLGPAESASVNPKGNDSKMPDAKEQRKERNELQKLLRILAKMKSHEKSFSSSEQQTNTSSDESSDILTDEQSGQENDPDKASNTTSQPITLGTSDFIENVELVKLLIKRNNELAQKEKFVKYLERERQKIERRSEAIKKREAKLMADMKAAAEWEVNAKIPLFKDALTDTSESQKSESHKPPLRPLSVRKFRARKDSSGSEDVASLSETDVSDFEGSKRALKDEEERETRQLEKLKRALETSDCSRRPGRKDMLMRRIEVLEKLLANNRAAVAMIESSTHVMPKIRKPRVAVQERSQESEESDASREGAPEKSQQSKGSVSESEPCDTSEAQLSVESKADSGQQYLSPKSSSSESTSGKIGRQTISEGAAIRSPSPDTLATKVPSAATSPPAEAPAAGAQLTAESSKSESSESSSTQSKSSEVSENTKNNKVDATVAMLVHNLKEETLNEVVRATKLDGHASNLMERLVEEAVGAINSVRSASPPSRGLAWNDFSPISSLNGTLAEIGQQIFVDDASQQVCIRTIPNKPPPPYTPPKVVQAATAVEPVQPKAFSVAPIKGVKEQRQPEPVVPMTLGELQTEASHAAEYLFEQLIAGRHLDEASYEDTHCQGVADMAKVQYGEMLFDVAKETAEKLFRVGRNSDNMFLRPLPLKERHQTFIDTIVGEILKSQKTKTMRPKCIWSYINNRRMDFIDFIMGKEIREEEREWTEYTSCLEQVNDQLVEHVFAHLVETNVATVLDLLQETSCA